MAAGAAPARPLSAEGRHHGGRNTIRDAGIPRGVDHRDAARAQR